MSRVQILAIVMVAGCSDGKDTSRLPPLTPIPSAPVQASAVTFPLAAAPSARHVVDATGAPFFIRGRTAWDIRSLPVSEYSRFLDDTKTKGFDAIEVRILTHHVDSAAINLAGNGAVAFSTTLSGRPWSGAYSPDSILTDAPDLTTPNESYWVFVDSLLTACEHRGIAVLFFPAYTGYFKGNDGWLREMIANGPAKTNAYGARIAKRYASRPNLIWMLGGDRRAFTTDEQSVERVLIDGLKSVPNQKSVLYSAEWKSGDASREHPIFGKDVNLTGVYSWEGLIASEGRTASAAMPTMPSFLLEEPYDEEARDGTMFNLSATQPVRRFVYWGWLTTIGGYVAGNGYIWRFYPVWVDHLNSAGAHDLAGLNAFVQTMEWWRLVPDGAEIGRLVTAGGGKLDAGDYVAAATTTAGDLLIANIGPDHAGPVSIDMTKMHVAVTARWFDPTGETYSSIGSFPSTGIQSFTPPGKNRAGAGDWVLRLDATRATP